MAKIRKWRRYAATAISAGRTALDIAKLIKAATTPSTSTKKNQSDSATRTKQQYMQRRGPKPRRISGFGGRLGGFYKKGRSTKVWPKRKVKRSPLRTLAKMQADGVLSTSEVGISTTGVSDVIYLGHATFALKQYRDILISTIIKRLFQKIQIPIKNFGDLVNLATNDAVVIEYKVNQDNGTFTTSASYTKGVAPVSYQELVDALVGSINWAASDLQFTRAYFNFIGSASGNPRQVQIMQLENVTVEIYCKSSLKLQNATVSSGGNEADEVDNVPISGKNYFGYGTGTVSNRTGKQEDQFWARADAGWMKVLPFVQSGMTQMPTASFFRNVKKMASHRVNPGTIKTSVLKDHYRVSLNWLVTKLTQNVTNVTDVSDIGKFRIFGFEHVIKAASDAPNIKVLGEVNYQLGMALSEKYTNVTDQKSSQAYTTY